jgi:hypothetical protein
VIYSASPITAILEKSRRFGEAEAPQSLIWEIGAGRHAVALFGFRAFFDIVIP